MSFHREALVPPMEAALASLGAVVAEQGFHLVGGTAVALHLGHRRSVDLDWFTTQRLTEPQALAASIRAGGVDLEIESVARGTFHGQVQGVRVSFLQFPYPLLGDPVPWAELGFSLLSLDDLAAMKLSAIAQRGARKDFVDLYAIAREHRPLPELLPLYGKKFGTTDIAHVLYGLSYFKDAESQPMPQMLWPEEWSEIKSRIQTWVRELGSES